MLTKSTASRTLGALVLVTSLFAVPACTDGGDGGSSETIAALRTEVQEAQRLNEQMAERMERFERKMDGFRQDVAVLGRARVEVTRELATATAEAATEAEAGLAAASAMGGDELAAALSTEDGRAAVEKAMSAIEAKRSSERRQRMVSGMVDRFAEQANLSPAQVVDMNRIVGDSFSKIGAVWSSMRGATNMSAEERTTLREDNMMKMEEIRTATSEEAKGVLDADQFAIYEEQAQRMRGFGGGRTRR